jgi:hypothetical protein
MSAERAPATPVWGSPAPLGVRKARPFTPSGRAFSCQVLTQRRAATARLKAILVLALRCSPRLPRSIALGSHASFRRGLVTTTPLLRSRSLCKNRSPGLTASGRRHSSTLRIPLSDWSRPGAAETADHSCRGIPGVTLCAALYGALQASRATPSYPYDVFPRQRTAKRSFNGCMPLTPKRKLYRKGHPPGLC